MEPSEITHFSLTESAWRQKDAANIREQTAQDELMKLKETVEEQLHTIKSLSDTRASLKQ